MDDALIRFRRAADQENQVRPMRRRYSPALRQHAVDHWQLRRRDEGVRTIASGRLRHDAPAVDAGGHPAAAVSADRQCVRSFMLAHCWAHTTRTYDDVVTQWPTACAEVGQ